MKALKPMMAAAALLVCATAFHVVPAPAATALVNQAIPDNDPGGLSSQLMVSGQSGNVSNNLVVSLNINGAYDGDLYAFLTHGTGFAILLNRVGRTAADDLGYGDAGFNVAITYDAVADIHDYGGNGGNLVVGTFQPDGRNVSPYDVLDTTPRTAMLSSFNGVDPNGAWTLFVADASGGDLHELKSWSLQFQAVPEPGCLMLALIGGVGLVALRLFRNRRSPATPR